MQISFYHLRSTSLERALPKLLEKAYNVGMKALILVDSEEAMDALNEQLWQYDPGSFLPHGSIADPTAQAQPILLSTTLDNQNNADILCITNGVELNETHHFARVLDIFDGNDETATTNARARWKTYTEQSLELKYIQQQENGSWKEIEL
jgi:DNA polymerase-3 subunit chi